MHTLFITVKFVFQSQHTRAKKKKKRQKTWTRSPNGHIGRVLSFFNEGKLPALTIKLFDDMKEIKKKKGRINIK